jgi:hypothetical protein
MDYPELRIWLDDKRPMPHGYDIHCTKARIVIELIMKGIVTKVSLDHDLGDEAEFGNGYMVAKCIEEQAYLRAIPRIEWHIHSQNSVGVASMRQALQNADRYWDGA